MGNTPHRSKYIIKTTQRHNNPHKGIFKLSFIYSLAKILELKQREIENNNITKETE